MIAMARTCSKSFQHNPEAANPIETLQKTVCASRLNCWLQCRLKFFFRYVQQIPKPPRHPCMSARWSIWFCRPGTWRGGGNRPSNSNGSKSCSKGLGRSTARSTGRTRKPEQKNTAWSLLETYFSRDPNQGQRDARSR